MRVVVVGAGLLGVATAYFLSRHGAQVTVLERQPGPGLETSYGNGALLHGSMVDPWNSPGVHRQLARYLGRADAPMLLRLSQIPALVGWGLRFLRESVPQRHRINMLKNLSLARYSLTMMAEIRKTEVINYGFVPSGSLMIVRQQEELERVRNIAELLAEHGVRFEVLDPDGILAREPALRRATAFLAGAVYYPEDERGDPNRFCEGLTSCSQRHGAEFHFNTTVNDFALDRNIVSGVETCRGRFDADAVVIAAGSYSFPMLRKIGMRLPVRPAKGYSVTAHHSSSNAPQVALVDHDMHAAIVPVGRDRLRAVGTAEFAGFDLRLDESRLNNIRAFLEALYPDYVREVRPDQIESWAGLRPMCADGVPLIGGTPVSNLYLNTGHGHLGWTMAAGSGKLLADILVDEQADIDPIAFAPARFRQLSG